MLQRWKLILGGLTLVLAVAVGAALLLGWRPVGAVLVAIRRAEPPIRLGLIHSQTGQLAGSEKSILDAEVLAIEEINAAGGVGGRRITWSAPDCRSDAATFAAEARRLIEQDKVAALFGGWTSESRKAVLPVLDEHNSLLFFPGNFEGIERSSHVIYAGGAANQSVMPAVRWAYDALGARKYFVVGLEEVWSRTSAEIAKDGIKAAGAELVGEGFTTVMTPSVDPIIGAIEQAKPDVVLNFMFGDSNPNLYAGLRRVGLPPAKLPVIAFGFAEDESRRFQQADIVGQYAAWNYFQSYDRPENAEFIRRFRARYSDNRVIGDPMVAAYNSIKFWAHAAAEVGAENIPGVINNLARQSMDAPDWIVTIDADSQSVWRPFHVGRLLPTGQFDIVWSIDKPIRPVTFVGTRTPEHWRSFLEGLKVRWRGRWAAGAAATAETTPTR